MTGRMAIYDIRREEFILIFLGGKRMMTGCIAITHTRTRRYARRQIKTKHVRKRGWLLGVPGTSFPPQIPVCGVPI